MEKKKCSRCDQKKTLDQFSWRSKKAGILHYCCRACVKIASNAHYEKNKEDYKKRALVFKKKQRKQLLTKIISHLTEHPCIDCGEDDVVVLQFDHVKGVKKDCVATMVNTCVSWDAIWKEMQKCVVRCANCHTRKTSKEHNWFRAK